MKVTRPQLSKVEYVKALPLFLTRAACLGYGGHTRVSESEAASAANVTAWLRSYGDCSLLLQQQLN